MKDFVTKSGGLMDLIPDAIWVHHCSLRNEEAYIHWIRRFIFIHDSTHPRELGEAQLPHICPHLAVDKHVLASA